MTTTQVVETLVTNNSLCEYYSHLDYHTIWGSVSVYQRMNIVYIDTLSTLDTHDYGLCLSVSTHET